MIGRLHRFVAMRVSRRLFAMFVLCAFLPLAAIAWLSLTQIRTLLLTQGDQRLAATAKSYGMSVFERLLLAGDIALAGALSPQALTSPDALALRTFNALTVIDGGTARAVIGAPLAPHLPEEARARLALGKQVLLLDERPAGPRVLVAAGLPPPATTIVVGEVKPETLWGPGDELPALTDFCVFQEVSRTLLYCSRPMDAEVLAAIAAPGASTLGTASWEKDGQAMRARAWTQFMRAAFGTPDWVVVASQPEAHQLARGLAFQRHYIPVIALALMLATWLTIRLSRAIVDPVGQLAERARGVSKNDFDTRLGLKREDEFGELATAFDHMSQRLGRQFASLTALSEIDRLILTTQDTVHVIRVVLQRLARTVPADLISVTLFEQDDPSQGRTFLVSPEAPDAITMVRHEVAAGSADQRGADPHGHWAIIPRADAETGLMTEMRERGISSVYAQMRERGIAGIYVQPIVWRGSMCGVLALGYRTESTLSDDEREEARELADRVAVAVSSAWRDERLYQQAHYDALTALPNRLLFKDRLGREIVRSQRERLAFALLFIDLDHFKNVNDSLGHTVGDSVLREAARRIARCLRESDTVARLGGDEFTVLLSGLNHVQEAWLLSESVVAALSQEFVLGDQRCFLSASVGIASYPADGATAEELLKSADTAMYRAKAAGRAQSVFFEERMNRETVARLNLDRDLRVAIERGELVMHYQPQLDLRTGAIRSAEALVRWKHPVHGFISPVRFIPLAEESGFIEHLGQWTIDQVCMQVKAWRAAGLPVDRVSVNVSPRQFRKRGIVDFLRGCAEKSGIPSSCLQIEITEGLLVDRGEAVESMLHELAAMGHGIALDDFGTGFSSMAYLKRFPVHTIKIDRVFIDGMERGPDAEAIASAIIAMSHALGKTVVAEGVETAEQVAILRRLRCDEIQGFFVAPGLPPDEFAQLVRARPAIAAA